MQHSASADEAKFPVMFSGGHDTDARDGGRPIVLIAAALEVSPDVFREAFRGVTPAKGRGPTEDEAKKNKAALMKVLRPHGVTNDRLDEVSNFYRATISAAELASLLAPSGRRRRTPSSRRGRSRRSSSTTPATATARPPPRR